MENRVEIRFFIFDLKWKIKLTVRTRTVHTMVSKPSFLVQMTGNHTCCPTGTVRHVIGLGLDHLF